MNEDMIFEKEMDAPENWSGDVILLRDGRGMVFEMEVPDDN